MSGEDLLTLRARTSFGTLPDLDESKVPAAQLAKIKETLEKLAEAAYRSGPESIVDLARGAAQWCRATWQADQKGDPALLNVDLGHWPKRLQEQDLNLLAGIAGAIARLHSRAKPNEQHNINPAQSLRMTRSLL
ncbi:MAG: hypothetical protein HC765_00345 [Brachymonas sp.]|nr:hypothetical protein [Brachymonas sp.]